MKRILFLLTLSTMSLLQAQSWTQPLLRTDNPAKDPYQYSVGINFGFSCQNCETVVFPALPANKRLVIEHVATYVQAPATGEYMCRIGPPGGPFMPLEAPRKAGPWAIASQPARLYLDQASLITCVRNEVSSIQWGGTAFVSGYLVDKP